MEINLHNLVTYGIGILAGILFIALIKYQASFIFFLILIGLVVLVCVAFYYYEMELLVCKWLLLHFKDSIDLESIDFENVDFDNPCSGNFDIEQGDKDDKDN